MRGIEGAAPYNPEPAGAHCAPLRHTDGSDAKPRSKEEIGVQQRMNRWKWICLGLILYVLIVSAAEVIAVILSSRLWSRIDLFNPMAPVLAFAALFLQGSETLAIKLVFLFLLMIEPLLLLLGWRLAARRKRSGSCITVSCALIHLLVHVFLIAILPMAGIPTVLCLAFPILLLVGYTKWQPPLKP